MNTKYINDIIKSLNVDIDNISVLNRLFVINNEETHESTLFMRTNSLSLADINNFCIEYGLSHDTKNQQILIFQTQIKY